MRAYEVRIKNRMEWSYDGQIQESILVLADDVTSAVMHASDHLEKLRVEFLTAGHKEAESLRISSITEQYQAVVGVIGTNRDAQAGDWVTELVSKYKKHIRGQQ